ncbi:hypothetical protein [Sphingomonas hankookensis]|uniref:hypothetical protein n=1 Tax=Sphingomonas hankookensis TaxID=563996 RepID=UPI003D302B7D
MSQGIGLPDGSLGGIAYDALQMARGADGKADRALQAVDSHEDICAERYKNINDKVAAVDAKVSTLFKLLAWGGTTALTLILALLGFLAKAQFDSITELQRASTQRAAILSEQIERKALPAPQVIIQPAPGAATTGASIERH